MLSGTCSCRGQHSTDRRADVIKEDEIQLFREDEDESLPDCSMAVTTCGSLTSGLCLKAFPVPGMLFEASLAHCSTQQE